MQVPGKKKFRIEEFISTDKANPIIQNINPDTQTLSCICKTHTPTGHHCFKCNLFVHACLAPAQNRAKAYECATCLNKSMDPLFQVVKILRESYFRTQSIFQYSNLISFEFELKPEDMDLIVQIRGLMPGSTSLCWPMQGGFSINDDKFNFHELKPLLVNSNRKTRREEYFPIPADKLRIGKNYLRFKIPCLDKSRFTSAYQYEQKKEYYFAVNLVKKLTPAQLETISFRERRTEQKQSLEILRQNNSDVEITQNKVSLMCPYTRERIKVPVRGRYCKHFSCICLQTLIASHSRTRFWNCPLCDYKLNQPYVDIWIYNMLIDNQRGSEVLVKEDGTYEWAKESEMQIMNLDSEEEQSLPYRQAEKASKVPEKIEIELPTKNMPKSIPNACVIELNDNQDQPCINPPIIQNQPLGITQPPAKSPLLISLEQQQVDKSKKRKQFLDKLKETNRTSKQVIPSLQVSEVYQNKAKKDFEASKTQKGSSSFEQIFQKKLMSKQDERGKESAPKSGPKPVMLFDIKPMDIKQLRSEQFKRLYMRGKVFNKYKKYIQTEQLRRLFKEIL